MDKAVTEMPNTTSWTPEKRLNLKRKEESDGLIRPDLNGLAVQHTPVLMVVIDEQGIVRQANPAIAHLRDTTTDKLTGRPMECIPGEVIQRAAQGEEPVVYECRLGRADGSSRTVRWSLRRAGERDDDSPLIVATGLDITERRAEQEQARLTEARLQATLILSRMRTDDQSQIYAYTLDQAIELTQSRAGFIALVDHEERLLEIPAWSHPPEAEPMIGHRPLLCSIESADCWADAARTGRPMITNRPIPRDVLKREYPGDPGSLKRQISVPVFSDGELVMIAGVADRDEDYTEADVRLLTLLMEDLWMVIQRQRAQRKLEASEERYRLLVESMSEGLAVFDIDFKITYVNDSLCHMLGYEADQLTTLTLASFLDESGLEIFYDQMARRRGQGGAPYEMQWRTRSGRKIPALVAPQPLFDPSGNFIGSFAVLTDISRQKHTEAKLHTANESLAAEQQALTEKNIALKEIMSQIESEKKAVQRQLQSNVDRVVLPLIRTLKSKAGEDSQVYVDLVESCLVDITSPFVNRLEQRFGSLSPREMEICNMIKAGLGSKDIAAALDTSVHTVHNQRKQIRRKLGLANSDANLSSYLNSLSD
jgi:PAS domain S-box-containing protein